MEQQRGQHIPQNPAGGSPAGRSTVIVAGARTPMGRMSGSLGSLPASELGAAAIRGALSRAGVAPDQVDYVILGQVLPAGAGQLPPRQAAAAAGIGMDVPSLGISKVCLSGLDAIALADQLIRAGEFRTVVAGGMESMTNAPHLLPHSRAGYKYGEVTLLDHMAVDGLQDAFTDAAMGLLTEKTNTEGSHGGGVLTREQQDAFAARSHQRAAAAQQAGRFADEIVDVTVPGRKGDVVVDSDEGIRPDTTVQTLAKLRPAFSPDGTITAGSASPISDGACAVVVMDKELAIERGLDWLAEIGPHGVVAGPDSSLQSQPANAIKAACAKAGIDPKDLDLIEINEAFAAVGIASTRELGVSEEIVNVNGGAIALGHPIGMSGARLVLTLALELKRRGGGTGAAALCGGGGQGDALLLTVPARP
ncbi:acetyl-CoA C-acetyltransferase [Nakamurella aerolata]|uniref:Probable acetyl-CoA acetyltransferase n=1 Tax=Nakamurella aerolata TaxID=1656892 RepID=A0A849A3C1_9ACTN|nr:acetyl-CoA C-acetyltransferase [Nakamurella aerolata]NNG34567.1 acetyl-CoA C-acetyltransferase [Nakamurella aerolata]